MDIKRTTCIYPAEFLACAAFRYLFYYPKRTYLKQIVEYVHVSETTLSRISQGKSKLTFLVLDKALAYLGVSMEEYGRRLDDMHRFNEESQLLTKLLDHHDSPSAMRTFMIQYVSHRNN